MTFLNLWIYHFAPNRDFLPECLVQVDFTPFKSCLYNTCWCSPSCSHLEWLHSVCLCFSVSLASPCPPISSCFLTSTPFLSPSVCESSSCSPFLAWAVGSISDQAFYCNHWPIPQPPFVPWPPFPWALRHGAFFPQAQAHVVVMIPGHLCYSQQLGLILLLLIWLHIFTITCTLYKRPEFPFFSLPKVSLGLWQTTSLWLPAPSCNGLEYLGYTWGCFDKSWILGRHDICLHSNPQPLSIESAALHSIVWFFSTYENYNTPP